MEREWIDACPVGEPEVVVSLPNGETLIALRVMSVDGYPMLPIRLDILGRPLSMAKDGQNIDFNTLEIHSNPRRVLDDADGA